MRQALGVKCRIQSDSTCMSDRPAKEPTDNTVPSPRGTDAEPGQPPKPREIGGRKGPEPTRYGDWEKGGRCIDF